MERRFSSFQITVSLKQTPFLPEYKAIAKLAAPTRCKIEHDNSAFQPGHYWETWTILQRPDTYLFAHLGRGFLCRLIRISSQEHIRLFSSQFKWDGKRTEISRKEEKKEEKMIIICIRDLCGRWAGCPLTVFVISARIRKLKLEPMKESLRTREILKLIETWFYVRRFLTETLEEAKLIRGGNG